MRVRKATNLALALLVAAGLGGGAAATSAQSAPAKKSPTAKTRSSMHRTASHKKSSRRERGQKAPTADRIAEIQEALGKDGSFSGKPNGKWDDSTVEAMKRFQETHGLHATGKLDAKTLQKLGLGSQTAGAAPPLPPISSSSLVNPSARTTHRQQ